VVHNVATQVRSKGCALRRVVGVLLRAALAGAGCVLGSLGIGGPPAVSWAGALLLLVALPLPHLLRARRRGRRRDAVAAADALTTTVGLAAPAAVLLVVPTGSDLLLGLLVACLTAALTVSVAARHELGPLPSGDR
jgi:hypothetical protein